MKKALLGTSAIALAGVMATPANAADWDVRVGGYYNAMVAYGQTNNTPRGTNFDGVHTGLNGEIHFLPSITLDNGIKIGARIELEGETDLDQIDESFLYVSGSFGRVNIGSENSAGYLMHYAAPNAAIISLNSPSTGDYIRWSFGKDSVFRGTLGTTFLEVGLNNDAKRITYFTPRFAGFQLGASYARSGDSQDIGAPRDIGSNEGTGRVGNIFDVGANYVQSFGDFNVAASARWGTGKSNRTNPRATNYLTVDGAGVTNLISDPTGGAVPAGSTRVGAPGRTAVPSSTATVLGFGLNLGYAGFTVGGSWAESNGHNGGIDDGIAYDAGVAYATGPWTFSFTYFHGENGEPGTAATGFFSGTKDKQDTYGVGVDYKLAKGVRLNLFGAYVDYDYSVGNLADRDGWVLGTGIGLNF